MEIHINTWGTSLRIIDGLLSVKWDKKVNQIPLGKIKCINLTKGISISSDVLYECLDQGIDIMISERSGYPLGRLWNNKFGSISNIRKKQMDFANGPDVVGWSIHNIQDKIDNQIDLLSCFLALDEPHESLITQTIQRLTINKNRLSDYKAMNHEEAFPKIRATEGQAAKLYFDCIVPHLPNRFQFVKRSKRPAKDITNSMLNYAYGMLYAHIESALIKAGLDPFIGFFHRNEYNRPVLTYDVIEPFRPWADWVVFHLCMNEVMDESFFENLDQGFWLVGEGKRILIQHFVDFFEEVIDYQDLHFSRYSILEKKCQQLAQALLNGDEKQ